MEKNNIYLSKFQINKIIKSIKNNECITLFIKTDEKPNGFIDLTEKQKDNIKKRKRINLNKKQVENIKKQIEKQTGGLFPLLIPALAGLAKAAALGSVGAVASFGTNKVLKKIAGNGCCCKKNLKKGKGIFQNWEK